MFKGFEEALRESGKTKTEKYKAREQRRKEREAWILKMANYWSFTRDFEDKEDWLYPADSIEELMEL